MSSIKSQFLKEETQANRLHRKHRLHSFGASKHLQVKGRRKYVQTNGTKKQAYIAILISGKIVVKPKLVRRDKDPIRRVPILMKEILEDINHRYTLIQ